MSPKGLVVVGCILAALSTLAGPVPVATAAEPSTAPLVSSVEARPRELVGRVLISGTLVPRDEILIAPEIDGVRIAELLVQEGDRVVKDQVLARLSRELLVTELAQNTAALARAEAAVAQGGDQIEQADAAAVEARLSLARAQSLNRTGDATAATLETRISASKSADGRLAAARNGAIIAAAELTQAKAQRTEIELRLARTEIKAPVDGIVSRRSARVGGMASATGEPLFRLIAHGTIELEADVTETALRDVVQGAPVLVDIGMPSAVPGRVRVIYPEVDRATRLGKVRITLDPDPALHIGGFARGTIETARRTGLAVPLAALNFAGDGGTRLLVVIDGRVVDRVVRTGLMTDGYVEVSDGLKAGDVVVARAGSFLRDGDAVRVGPTDASSSHPNRL